MSFADTKCPCGGKKEQETMLCATCERELADRPEMAIFKNTTLNKDCRRHAAVILLSLSRRRGTLRVQNYTERLRTAALP